MPTPATYPRIQVPFFVVLVISVIGATGCSPDSELGTKASLGADRTEPTDPRLTDSPSTSEEEGRRVPKSDVVDEPTSSPRGPGGSLTAHCAKLAAVAATGWWSGTQDFDPFRNGVPVWSFDERFATDAFRFVRVKFDSTGWRSRGGNWRTDYPDSDLNFSLRLQQLTSMKVNPVPDFVELTDPKLFEYPFLYMIEPGSISLSPREATALREYLERGGFMMVDDFWGEEEYRTFYLAMKQVFPDREPIDLTLEHDIFHNVYDLPELPQVPSIHSWQRTGGLTYERSDAQQVHYRAFHDDQGRMVMIICHNTDLGDGWEREGESREYFETFSEKLAYPMGINIVVYALTH